MKKSKIEWKLIMEKLPCSSNQLSYEPLTSKADTPGLPRDRRGHLRLYYRGSSQIEGFPMKLTKSVSKIVWNASWNLHLWATTTLSLSLCHRSNESDEEARVRCGRQSNQRSLFSLPCALSYYFTVSYLDQNRNLWLVNTSSLSSLVPGVKTWQEQWHGDG